MWGKCWGGEEFNAFKDGEAWKVISDLKTTVSGGLTNNFGLNLSDKNDDDRDIDADNEDNISLEMTAGIMT